MRSSHSLDRLDTAFDDDHLVAHAGLLLPATLAQQLGLKALVDTKTTTYCTDPTEASWVGVGGDVVQKLMQDGTYIDTDGHYHAFHEYLSATNPNPLVEMKSVTVHPGDSIHDYVVHQTSGAGTTTFYVADNTTGTDQSVIVDLGSGYYDGHTAPR